MGRPNDHDIVRQFADGRSDDVVSAASAMVRIEAEAYPLGIGLEDETAKRVAFTESFFRKLIDKPNEPVVFFDKRGENGSVTFQAVIPDPDHPLTSMPRIDGSGEYYPTIRPKRSTEGGSLGRPYAVAVQFSNSDADKYVHESAGFSPSITNPDIYFPPGLSARKAAVGAGEVGALFDSLYDNEDINRFKLFGALFQVGKLTVEANAVPPMVNKFELELEWLGRWVSTQRMRVQMLEAHRQAMLAQQGQAREIKDATDVNGQLFNTREIINMPTNLLPDNFPEGYSIKLVDEKGGSPDWKKVLDRARRNLRNINEVGNVVVQLKAQGL